MADNLHGNFYEDETTPEDIEDSLNDVERCLDKMEPALGLVRRHWEHFTRF